MDLELEDLLTVSEVKITDFGLSMIPGEENEFMRKRFSFQGTPYYMSPESVLLGIITPSLDIWSLGCVVLVEMVTGNVAWDSSLSTDELMVEIACGDPTKIPETMSELGKDFLRGCFERNPLKRLIAEMLLLHPFLVEGSQGSPSAGSALGCSSSASMKPYASKNFLPSPPGFSLNTNKPPSPETIKYNPAISIVS